MKPKAFSYIRFSTPEQLKGDSLRRQTEAAEKYAKENGLTLDTSLNMQALGQSAHKGVHRTKGPLGVFLKLVERGKIARGSVLIVENLDRLTREEIIPAQQLFFSIIEAGIKLVTLTDRQEYTSESINNNPMQLIISIVTMMRGHDESNLKSIRISSVWDKKRKDGKDGKILTANCPAWLTLSEDRSRFIVKKEVVRVIKRIFKMKLNGVGEDSIANELNKTADLWRPPETKHNKSGGWKKLYIKRILRNRAVIGEYTPHRMIKIKSGEKDGRYKAKENSRLRVGYPTREKASDPIPDYFPAIIDLQTFNRTQYLIQETIKHRGNFGGQTGKATNLFVYLVQCGLCKSPMHYIDKGKRSKPYLHCDHSRRNMGCNAKAIRYDEFQDIIFDDLEELDVSKLNPDQEEFEKETDSLQATIEDNKQRLSDVNKKINNLVDLGEASGDPDIMGRLWQRKKERLEIEKHIKDLEQQRSALLENSHNQREKVDVIKEVKQLLDKAKDEDQRIALRLRLRAELRKLIDYIKVWPLQEKYVQPEEKDIDEEIDGEVVYMASKYIRMLGIAFKGGNKYRLLDTILRSNRASRGDFEWEQG